MLTEEEAKQRWCPFSRASRVMAEDGGGIPRVVAAVNRNPTRSHETRCIGSACMAWRESLAEGYLDSESNAWKPRGYCGLAGKP